MTANMKVILPSFLIASLCAFSIAQHGGKTPESALTIAEHVLRIATPLTAMTHEMTTAFPEIYTKARNLTKEAKTCIDNLKTENATVCTKLESVNYVCAVDLKVYYERALPKSAESLPRLMRDSYVKSIAHVCKLQVKTFFELMNECIATANADLLQIIRNNRDDSRPTVKKVLSDHQAFTREPTRARLCRTMESMKNYMEQELGTYCSNRVSVQATLDLYGAAVSPCKHNDSL